jgi:hypothetical protein
VLPALLECRFPQIEIELFQGGSVTIRKRATKARPFAEAKMIFPGMDPYLELPSVWTDFHSRLIVYLAEHLGPLLRPRYIASVQTRVYIEGAHQDRLPDVGIRQTLVGSPRGTAVLEADVPVEVQVQELEIEETYLHILDLEMNQRVVTVLEAISPTNKYSGPGRDGYLSKQSEVRRSDSHLVEIDLLRTGPHVAAVPEKLARGAAACDYLVCVNRAEGKRSRFQLYPRRLRERLPRFLCPLAPGDHDVVVNLQAVVERTYEVSGYENLLRYDQPCVPPLSAEDQAWAKDLIHEKWESPRTARP